MPFACSNSSHSGPQTAACCRKCYELVCATCPPAECGAEGAHDAASLGRLANIFSGNDADSCEPETPAGAGVTGSWAQDLRDKIGAARRNLDRQKELLALFYQRQRQLLEATYESEIEKALALLREFGGGDKGSLESREAVADAVRATGAACESAKPAPAAEASGNDDEKPLLLPAARAYSPAVDLEVMSWRRLTPTTARTVDFKCSGVSLDGSATYLAGPEGLHVYDTAAGEQPRRVSGEVYSAIFLAPKEAVAVLNYTRKAVQTLSLSGEVLEEFPLQNAVKPTGLCRTDDGLFLVTDIAANKVSVYAEGGQLKAEINKIVNYKWVFFSPECAASVGHRKFVVTDGKRCCVLCLDYDGQLLWRFGRRGRGPGDLWAPAGLCADGRGCLYVADKGNRRVTILFASGGLVGHLNLYSADFHAPYLTSCSLEGSRLAVVCSSKADEQKSIRTFSITDY